MPLPATIQDSDLGLDTLPVPDFASFTDQNYPDMSGDFDGNAADLADAAATIGAASSVLDAMDTDFVDVLSIAPGLDTSAIDTTVAQFDGVDVPSGNAILGELGGIQSEWTPSGTGTSQGPPIAGGTGTGTAGAATLSSVGITSPGLASIGDAIAFKAFANFSDGTQLDVTAQAAWLSSNPAVVSVDATGNGQANAIGTATISATYQGMKGSAGIAVQSATASAPPPGTNVTSVATAQIGGFPVAGGTFQEVLWGTYSDGSQRDVTGLAMWQSSNPAVASVDANGVITFNAPGAATITGSYLGFTSSTTFTVIGNVGGAPPPAPTAQTGANCGTPGYCIDPNTGECLPAWQCPSAGSGPQGTPLPTE